MSDDYDDVIDNLSETSAWIRILFMAAFSVLLHIILVPVIVVVAIVQALFTLFSGKENSNLKQLGAAISTYLFQIVQFLTYNSDEKPFPFSDFPLIDEDDEPGNGVPPAKTTKADKSESAEKAEKAASKKSSSSQSTAKKSSARKSPAKKAAAKKAAPKKATAKKAASKSAAKKLTDIKAAQDQSDLDAGDVSQGASDQP